MNYNIRMVRVAAAYLVLTGMVGRSAQAMHVDNQFVRDFMREIEQGVERNRAIEAARQRRAAEQAANLEERVREGRDLTPDQRSQLERLQRQRDSAEERQAKIDDFELKFYGQVGQVFAGAMDKELNKAHYDKERESNMVKAIGEADVKAKQTTEQIKHIFSRDNMRNMALCSTAAIAGYFAIKFGYHYAEKQLGIPSLVRETSRKSLMQQITEFFSEEQKPQSLDDVILPKSVHDAISAIAHQAQTAHDNGLPYRNVMLYGPPGTGKTMFARRLAYASGMDYALMTGADFSQFFGRNEEVQKLHELLDWAESCERGMILFIDEADSFCSSMNHADIHAANVLNAFKARTGTRSEKLMIIFATNHPEAIDRAILSRVDSKVFFPLPSLQEREKLFWLYANKYLFQHRGKLKRRMPDGSTMELEVVFTIDDDVNEAFLSKMAVQAEGLAGREIEQVMASIQSQVYLNPDDLRVTSAMMMSTLQTKVKEQQHVGSWTMAGQDKTTEERSSVSAPAA